MNNQTLFEKQSSYSSYNACFLHIFTYVILYICYYSFSEENKAKRKPFTYLPFGDGPRICAGMRLAKLEFKMAVVQMLRNFRLVACDKTEVSIPDLCKTFSILTCADVTRRILEFSKFISVLF